MPARWKSPLGILVLLLAWGTLSAAFAENVERTGPATTVILVRHAEKADRSGDTALSERGVARAVELARTLADMEIEALYASQYLRTRQTLEPIAALLELQIRVVAVEGDDLKRYASSFARRLLEVHEGGTVLVAGHSNTVPLLVEALGASPAPRLDEGDYDDLFVVTVGTGGTPRLLHLHYGPSPRDAGETAR